MMDCKKALTAADGDLDRAIEDLRKKSALKAAAKASRTAAEGLLALKVADDRGKATLVEVNIETDFAARNDKFAAFLDTVAEAAFAAGASDVAAVMGGDLEARREALVQEIGENVTVRRVVTFESSGGHVASYLHTDRRKGAIVELEGDGDLADLGRDLAMHVTAAARRWCARKTWTQPLSPRSVKSWRRKSSTAASRRRSRRRWSRGACARRLRN